MFSKIRPAKSVTCFVWTLALALSPLLRTTTHAQVAGATLSGIVADQSGGVIPQVSISVKNTATDITRTTTTSAAGFYSVPNLLPGTYEVKAEAKGFSSEMQAGITLTVGEQQVLNFTLRVGQASQTVVVTTEAPNVELASSSISATVTSPQFANCRSTAAAGPTWRHYNRASAPSNKSNRTSRSEATAVTAALATKSPSPAIAPNKITIASTESVSTISTTPPREARFRRKTASSLLTCATPRRTIPPMALTRYL